MFDFVTNLSPLARFIMSLYLLAACCFEAAIVICLSNLKSGKKIHPHETNYLKLDCTKSKTRLSWETKMNLDLALEYTVEWYKKYMQKENLREFSEKQIENFGRL